jgi:phosphate transport system substrate-binding protein
MSSRGLVATRVVLAMTVATLAGCQTEPLPTVVPAYPELGITLDNYPNVDGSTSAQPLLAKAVCSVLGVGSTWAHSDEDDSRTLWANDYAGDKSFESYYRAKIALYNRINNLIHYSGTHEAYVNLVSGQADLILVARLPSEDELRLGEKRKVSFDSRPVALDAFVFLLNSGNPVETLTIEQIRDIYSGRIVNWREAGGPDATIRPYQRNRNSGSQELMQKLVMKERAMIKAPDLLVGTLMSTTFLTIENDVQGIGYSVYYYQEFMAPPSSTKACAVEGVLPTSETIRSRQYPFVTEVYVVVRRDLPPEHLARRLRDWLLSPTGQRMVEQTGYVPVSPPVNPP